MESHLGFGGSTSISWEVLYLSRINCLTQLYQYASGYVTYEFLHEAVSADFAHRKPISSLFSSLLARKLPSGWLVILLVLFDGPKASLYRPLALSKKVHTI